MKHFDYIIAGGGCAGRSLAIRLLPHLEKTGKSALLVDQAQKRGNDRTWCFWETADDIFQPVVCKTWDQLAFVTPETTKQLEILPYQYKMIRSGDFYTFTDRLLSHPNISTKIGQIDSLTTYKDRALLVADGETFTAAYIFSSIPQPQTQDLRRYTYLLQHFEGWIMEAQAPVFDPTSARIMDFNTSQAHGTAFVYVLPLSATRALVEYTVFSADLLPSEVYREELERYVRDQLKIDNYTCLEKEKGVIPMNDHPVETNDGRIFYLGTAGGDTKGSTGYTFKFIQKHCAAIVDQLETTGRPIKHHLSPKRFKRYDSTLLLILAGNKLKGMDIFSTLFLKNDANMILKFLDNESSLADELRIFSTLQIWTFAKAFIQSLLRPYLG